MRQGVFRISILPLLVLFGCSEKDEVAPESSSVKVMATGSPSEEGVNGTFSIRLEERMSTDLIVELLISGTAKNGIDYELIPEQVTIPANVLNAQILIKPIGDQQEEGDELVELTIDAADNTHVPISSASARLTILDGSSAQDRLRDEVRPFMSNQQASDETVSLYYNLLKIAKSGFIVGQQDAFTHTFGNVGGESDIRKATGSEPGLLGSDFMFATDDQNNGQASNWFYQQEQLLTRNIAEAYSKGMVNLLTWHFREPFQGQSFYTSEMSDSVKEHALRSILPGAENHLYYRGKLDQIANILKNITGSFGTPLPVIFRPFHEFDGDWFWWGESYCTPEEFIQCWRFTFDYLVNTHGLDNILFAFSPDNKYLSEAEYLERYPGDAYVDILGMDNYGDFDDAGMMALENPNFKIKIIDDLAKAKGKVAALTETCYFVTPGTNNPLPDFYSEHLFGALTQNEVQVSFMMFWQNTQSQYCTPPPGESALTDFLRFIDFPETLLASDLPDIYKITIDEET